MSALLRRLVIVVLLFVTGPPFFPASALAQFTFEPSVSCSTTSVGRTPISDLGAGFYQGYQGGL
ncbi:MAG: hypothetical protein AAB393_03225 [Bacteroidota bacterium]